MASRRRRLRRRLRKRKRPIRRSKSKPPRTNRPRASNRSTQNAPTFLRGRDVREHKRRVVRSIATVNPTQHRPVRRGDPAPYEAAAVNRGGVDANGRTVTPAVMPAAPAGMSPPSRCARGCEGGRAERRRSGNSQNRLAQRLRSPCFDVVTPIRVAGLPAVHAVDLKASI